LNTFNNATAKEMDLSLLLQDEFFLIVFASIFVVSIISSIYPSWLITSVNSLDLFKQKIFPKKRNQLNLKKYLIGFQFAISIGLITVAILMSRQIQYTHQQDLGFTKDQLLFVEMSSSNSETTFGTIKNQFTTNPAIESVSLSRGFPIHSSRHTSSPMINREGGPKEELTEVRSFWVSYDFVETLDIQMAKGRDFSIEFPSDIGRSCLINETAARHFGWDDPIGKFIDNKKLQVVGVFRDILFHDPYNQIKPLVLTVIDDNSKISGPVYLGFRIKEGSFDSTKSTIANTLKKTFPNDPFEVKRFEDHYANNQIFKIFNTINNIFIFFSIIGILLSVFGIIGLVNHSLTQRTKEIAIRKVSGCSSLSIFRSLMIEYIIIIIIAGIFGSLAAHYIFGKMPIYYPIEQTILDYLIAVMIALVISLLAISVKTFKESTRNPVEALRYE
jgi:putative ABC transport system permease protein